MLVRVFDNQRKIYFKSEVYAIINSGWYEKRLVVFSFHDKKYFKFFDYLDKDDSKIKTHHKVLINSISSNVVNLDYEWIYQKNDDVDKKLEDYAQLLDDNIRFFEYSGYSWIYKNKSLLIALLKGNMISIENYKHLMPKFDYYKLEGWNYVDTQQDVEFILEQTSSFHDSILKELNYISGCYVDNEKNMHFTNDEKRVIMRFDSQWCSPIVMVFEGVTALNLRPTLDNYSSEIFGVSLFLKDATVYFCDDQIDDIDKNYEGTWIESYSLRWQFSK